MKTKGTWPLDWEVLIPQDLRAQIESRFTDESAAMFAASALSWVAHECHIEDLEHFGSDLFHASLYLKPPTPESKKYASHRLHQFQVMNQSRISRVTGTDDGKMSISCIHGESPLREFSVVFFRFRILEICKHIIESASAQTATTVALFECHELLLDYQRVKAISAIEAVLEDFPFDKELGNRDLAESIEQTLALYDFPFRLRKAARFHHSAMLPLLARLVKTCYDATTMPEVQSRIKSVIPIEGDDFFQMRFQQERKSLRELLSKRGVIRFDDQPSSWKDAMLDAAFFRLMLDACHPDLSEAVANTLLRAFRYLQAIYTVKPIDALYAIIQRVFHKK